MGNVAVGRGIRCVDNRRVPVPGRWRGLVRPGVAAGVVAISVLLIGVWTAR